jgi:hypothetical protein
MYLATASRVRPGLAPYHQTLTNARGAAANGSFHFVRRNTGFLATPLVHRRAGVLACPWPITPTDRQSGCRAPWRTNRGTDA